MSAYGVIRPAERTLPPFQDYDYTCTYCRQPIAAESAVLFADCGPSVPVPVTILHPACGAQLARELTQEGRPETP